jgi:hypothetical protein
MELVMRYRISVCLCTFVGVGLAGAEPIEGIYFDIPGCDNHGFQQAVEEFGDPAVFSPDEAIAHVSTFFNQSACPPTDNDNIPNALVEIVNLTGRFVEDLYYVGDPSTVFTNVDGIGDAGVFPDLDGLAFRIDSFGLNRPLIFESLTPDGVFEPGEIWHFIVQDYFHPAGLAPDSFFSIGMADASVAVIETSAASIVRMVPAPSTVLLALGGLAMLRRRR